MSFSDDIKKKIDRALKDAMSKKSMQSIANIAANQIKRRTRLGKGVDSDNGSERPFRPLKDKTKARRRGRRLHPTTRPSKSNLTQSGQMTDAIKGKGYPRGLAEVVVEDSNRDDADINNQDLAQAHEDAKEGRKFMHMSKLDKKKISNKIRKDLLNNMRKLLK